MLAGTWKVKHPGVPRDWTQIGEGGNAIVWRSGTRAIKRLKNSAAKEARERFRRECALMEELGAKAELRIVPVVEVRNREGADEIVMEALDGDLDKVVERFRCQPIKAAAALIGVVETLASLAACDRPLHHRDLKPSNILYRGTENDLYVGDFGCAYLAGDDRITPDLRAIGAWAYRPPEYSTGPIANINEKGDVFSLGKILWTMINGSRGVTFPGPVWFLPEYDLTLNCENAEKSAHAMYIIARCCDIQADRRASFKELRTMLEALMCEKTSPALALRAEALKREQVLEIEYAQRQAIARPFVTMITQDFREGCRRLYGANPQSMWIRSFWEEWERVPGREVSMIEQVVVHESDAPLIIVLKLKHMLNTRFWPERGGKGLHFVASFGLQQASSSAPSLTVEAHENGVLAHVTGLSPTPEISSYDQNTIPDFLLRAIDVA